MALSKTQVSELYVAIFNRASEGEGNEYWQGFDSVAEAANAMLATDDAQDYFGTSLDSDQAFVEHIYLNTLDKTPADDAAGIQFWVDQLASGASRGEMVANLTFAAQQPENAGAAQDQFLNRVAVSDYTADVVYDLEDVSDYGQALGFDGDLTVTADNTTVGFAQADVDQYANEKPDDNGGEQPGTPGDSFTLTDGRDGMTGTDNDDTFYADAGQNQNGSISNAFATGDVIDGGAGRDKIEAAIMEDQEVASGADSFINARTMNVEEAYFNAMSLNGNGANQEAVTVDAGRMDSVDQFWSDDSSANLVIDDVRLGSKLSITKDITFGLRDVDTDAGLSAWFDTNSLTNEGDSQVNSSLVIRAADVSTETPTTPLANVELEIGFSVGGETVQITVQSTDGTYAGLRTAIDDALADAGRADLNVTLGEAYNEVVFAGNTTVLPFTAQEVLITDPNGNEFADVDFQTSNLEPVDGGFLLAGNAAPQDPSVTSSLIETNVILDNAGRGSTAGDVYIGGMSNSGKVIEKANVTVDRSSKIDDLMTGSGRTGNTAFQQIVVDSGEAEGDVVIGDVGNTYNFDSTAFTGENLSVSGLAGWDVDGDDADSADAAIAQAHVYNTSASNDTVNVQWSLDNAAEFNDFSLSVNTGAGNDTVYLLAGDDSDFSLPNQQDQGEVMINTGTGDDWVRTEGAGSVTIDTGAGTDTIYTDNSGSQWMDKDANAATWLVGASNTDVNDIDGNPAFLGTTTAGAAAIPTVMYGSQVSVTFSGAATGGAVTNGVASALDNGFESVVDIELDAGEVFGDRTDLNDAIKRAINEDSVLSKLLVATDGPDNTLVIRSLVDGSFVAEDLEISYLSAQSATQGDARYLDSSDTDMIQSAIRAYTDNSGYNYTDAVLTNTATAVDAVNGMTTAGGSGAGSVQATATAGGTAETFDADFGASTSDAGDQLAFDGVTVTLGTNANATAVATDFVTEYNTNGARSYNAVDNGDGTVDFTSIANGDRIDVTNGNFTFTDQGAANTVAVTVSNIVNGSAGGAALTGTASTADNTGNVVDAGAGDDVVVLSTNADSNETISFSGYANGDNTIVNFDDDSVNAGADSLDFQNYLTTMGVGASGSNDSQFLVENGVVAGTLEANHVSLVEFVTTTGANAELYDGITSSNLVAALNGTGTVDFGDLGASTTLSTIAASEFVGDSYKAIVMIENDLNDGEYQAWEVTVGQDTAGAGTAVATGAQLIGTYDFGEELGALGDTNLVG